MDQWQRNQLAITAAAFVGFAGFTLVMPFLALYMQELGVTNTGEIALWTGVTLGVTPAITALCSPLWGRVGDRFGNKVLVQRSLIAFVVVMVLMAYATSPWHLLALRVAQGFVGGYGPLMISMAALGAPRHRLAQAIGTVQTAQRMGPAVGPLAGGILAAAVGLRNTFLVSAVVYAFAVLLVTRLYNEPQAHRRRAGTKSERVTFGSILAFENFVLLIALIFGLQLVDRSFGPVLLLYLDELGYGQGDAAVTAGVLFSALAIFGALGNQLAAALLRRMTARAIITWAVLIAAGALALFASSRGAWQLVTTIAIFGAAVGTAMTMVFTAAGSVIPRHAHGAGFGLLSSASLFGVAVSPVLSGLVAVYSIRVVFFSGVVALAVLALVVQYAMVERPLDLEVAPSIDET